MISQKTTKGGKGAKYLRSSLLKLPSSFVSNQYLDFETEILG